MKPAAAEVQRQACTKCGGDGSKKRDGVAEICKRCDGIGVVCTCHEVALWNCPDNQEAN